MEIIRKYINFFKRWILWVLRQKGTPRQRALGLAIGVFCGCFPFFGFQTFLGIALASFFRANPLLAILGTWVSNPFTYLPLFWFNYHVGSSLLGKGDSSQNLLQISGQDLFHTGLFFSSRLLLGSTFVGFLSALLVGLLTYKFSRSR